MNRPPHGPALLLMLRVTLLVLAASAVRAAPALSVVDIDGGSWILLDDHLAAGLAVEWRPPWLTLRMRDRSLRAASGWRAAALTGAQPALCWMPDPVRALRGRPALSPAALAVALTSLGDPVCWNPASRELMAAAPRAAAAPEPAGGPEPVIPSPRRVAAPVRRGARVIIVDAGHGGHDCGARGRTGLCEKDVTLDIARRVAAVLKGRGAQVVMTRDSDRYVSLADRVAITRRADADLFVSVHVNASPNRSARGVETYVYGARALGRSAEAAVRRENADANYMEIVLGDLEQQAHHESSIRVADAIETTLVGRLRTVGRGRNRVFAAPFYVLARAGRPAVLVEVGFISHRDEEHNLRDAAYRRQIADSIAGSVDLNPGPAAMAPGEARGG